MLAASVDHNKSMVWLVCSLGNFACQALAGFGRIEQSAAQFDQQLARIHVFRFSEEAGGFRISQCEVHVLDGLPGRAFTQIVDR